MFMKLICGKYGIADLPLVKQLSAFTIKINRIEKANSVQNCPNEVFSMFSLHGQKAEGTNIYVMMNSRGT